MKITAKDIDLLRAMGVDPDVKATVEHYAQLDAERTRKTLLEATRTRKTKCPGTPVPWRLTDNAGTVLCEHANLDTVLWVGLDPEQNKAFRYLRLDRLPTAGELKTLKNYCGYMPTLVFHPPNLNPPLGSLVAELWTEDPLYVPE